MAFSSCCCEIVLTRKLAVELGFSQLKSTDVYEDNTGWNNIPSRGRSSASVLCSKTHSRWNLTRQAMPCCSANYRHRDKCLASLSHVPFESLTYQLLDDKHVGDKWIFIRPFQSKVCRPSSFHVVCLGRLSYLHALVLLYVCILALNQSWWLISKAGQCALLWHNDNLLWVYYLHMPFAHTSNMDW